MLHIWRVTNLGLWCRYAQEKLGTHMEMKISMAQEMTGRIIDRRLPNSTPKHWLQGRFDQLYNTITRLFSLYPKAAVL